MRSIFSTTFLALLLCCTACSNTKEAMESSPSQYMVVDPKYVWNYVGLTGSLFPDPPERSTLFLSSITGDFNLEGKKKTKYAFKYQGVLFYQRAHDDNPEEVFVLYSCTFTFGSQQEQTKYCVIEKVDGKQLWISSQFYDTEQDAKDQFFDDTKKPRELKVDIWMAGKVEFANRGPLR